MVGKYALICAMEIQKIRVVVHIFSGFALFTGSECIAELNPSICKLLTANKVHFDKRYLHKFLATVSFEACSVLDQIVFCLFVCLFF